MQATATLQPPGDGSSGHPHDPSLTASSEQSTLVDTLGARNCEMLGVALGLAVGPSVGLVDGRALGLTEGAALGEALGTRTD